MPFLLRHPLLTAPKALRERMTGRSTTTLRFWLGRLSIYRFDPPEAFGQTSDIHPQITDCDLDIH